MTVTYRLAPLHRWPSGPEDLSRVVQWLRANIAAHGGDPEAIFLMGQSAGAAHVGAYVSHAQFHPGAAAGIAGAVMISGMYDPTTQPPNPFSAAYYGEGTTARDEARAIPGLLSSDVPLLFTVSGFDAQDFQDQAAQLGQAWHQHKALYPPMEYLAGHNHLSPGQAIGSVEDDLGPRVAAFVAAARSLRSVRAASA